MDSGLTPYPLLLHRRRLADLFRREAERNRYSKWLDRFVREAHLGALDFFRSERGKGAKAIDVSNFFYRARQHVRFAEFWNGRSNKRRRTAGRFLAKFQAELQALVEAS